MNICSGGQGGEHSFAFGGMPFKAQNRLNFAFCLVVEYFFKANISVENSRVFVRVFVVYHRLVSPAFSVKENGCNRFIDCNRLVFGRLCYLVIVLQSLYKCHLCLRLFRMQAMRLCFPFLLQTFPLTCKSITLCHCTKIPSITLSSVHILQINSQSLNKPFRIRFIFCR